MKNKWLFALMVSFLAFTPVVANAEEYQDTYIDEDIQEEVEEIATEYGISPEFVLALIEKESSGKEDAKNGGCIGLMQIHAKSHKAILEAHDYTEKDLYNSWENINVGCEILRDLFEEYSDPAVVLMIYNGYGVRESIGMAENGQISKHATKILDRAYEIERAKGK